MKKFLANLLLALVVTVFFLTLLEVGARLASKTTFKGLLNVVDVRSKLEKAYLPPFSAKEDDRLRIVVFGGSTVQGIPVDKLGFVSQLDYQIRHMFKEEKDVEVINLGWSGYNTTVVRYLLSQAVNKQPDLLIVYSGHNEFIYPQFDSYFLLKVYTALKNRSMLVKTLAALNKAKSQSQQVLGENLDKKWQPYRQQKLFYAIKMFIFRQNLKAITQLATQHKIPLVLCTVASNIADWPPVSREIITLATKADYFKALNEINQKITENDLSQAEVLTSQALDKYPSDAELMFLGAKIASASGNLNQAQDLFIKAKDWDYVPWRATVEQNKFIRSLADNKYVWLADIDQVFKTHSFNQLPGFNLVLDDVHPNKQGHYLITTTILEVFKKNKLGKKDRWNDTEKPYSLDQLLLKMDYSSKDEFDTYYRTAKYSFKSPFLHLDIAQMYLEKAEMVDNNDWQAKALQASIEFFKGNNEQGQEWLKKAEVSLGRPLISKDNRTIPYLEQLMERMSQ